MTRTVHRSIRLTAETLAKAKELAIRSRMIADEASTAFYATVRLTGTSQSLTCYNGTVWLISNLEGAKTTYRDATGELAKLTSKVRPSDKTRQKAVAAGDLARPGKQS